MALDLTQPGAYGRTGGGNQQIPDIQKQVVKWIAWSINADNGGGGGTAVWDPAIALWNSVGIQNFPWMHVRSMADLQRLIQVGQGKNSPAIGCNIENVVEDKLDLEQVGNALKVQWGKPVHMATLCWVQNGQGWQHVGFCVAALEMFYDEVPACRDVDGCVKHALAEGFSTVTLMYKTKLDPSQYDLSVCHSLYTSDDITPTLPAWLKWKAPEPCKAYKEKTVPLTEKQFPYTGPFYEGDKNHPTIKGLKRGQIRLGNLNQPLGNETDDFGPALKDALKKFQRDHDIQATGAYGRNTWQALRSAKVSAEMPHAGEYAMDSLALKYVREDALTRVYPHPEGSLSQICQGLHPTAGLSGNWAIDFCAPGGTKVLAVEKATITRLSGRDPSEGANQTIGIFGWSIHYETPTGYRYFSTHYGARSPLSIGQVVEVGQVLGTVGSWPGDPSRSHTHLGVTSPLGTADAKKRITEVSQASKVPA